MSSMGLPIAQQQQHNTTAEALHTIHEQHGAASYAAAATQHDRRGTGAACLEVALALVDANHLVLIDLLPRLHKQPPALLHALNGVRSHLPIYHAFSMLQAALKSSCKQDRRPS